MPTGKQIKRQALELIRNKRPSPFFVALVFLLISYAVEMLVQKMNIGPIFVDLDAVQAGNVDTAVVFDPSHITVLSSLILIAFQLILFLIDYGFRSYSLLISRKQDCDVKNLFDGFFNPIKVIWLYILKGILVSVLFCLFVVPGIIFSYAYSHAEFILKDHPDWTVVQCLRESRKQLKGYKWKRFCLDISYLFWHILSSFPGAKVFTNPYIHVGRAVFYNYVCGYTTANSNSVAAEALEQEQ